jgi:large subunit ribosomal protein L5
MSRLRKKYKEEIIPELKKIYSEKNPMQLPVLKKIVISMGLAVALTDKSAVEIHAKELALISGQKPIVTKSKKAISNFKLREGFPIGLKVTLRGSRMYDFLDRFCNIVTPRISDFRGFSSKCDGRGSLNIGISDQLIFPEIDLDAVKRNQGMNIVFVTTSSNDEECITLLKKFGFPFK